MHTNIETAETLHSLSTHVDGARERADMAEAYDRWVTLKARMDAAWLDVVAARAARKEGGK